MAKTWLEHVKETRSKNSSMSYSEALKEASKSWTKKTVQKKQTGGGNPWLKHVAAFRKNNPNLKYSEVLKQAKKTYKKST